MADKKISDFTAATSLAAADLFEIETSGGNSRKITASDAAAALHSLAPGYEAAAVDVPLVADLIWVNQGTASVADGTDALIITNDNDLEYHMLVKTAPAAPYDVYMRLDALALSTAATSALLVTQAGIVLRDSSDGEFISFFSLINRDSGDEQNLYGVAADRWTNPTTFSATSLATRYGNRQIKWLRVNVNSTTITFYASMDGNNWHSLGTETIATFVDTVDQIGIGIRTSSNNTTTILQVAQFGTTAP